MESDHYRPQDVRLIVLADSGSKDLKIKLLKKKYSRKSFSPYPRSWEIDHLDHTHGKNTYLLAKYYCNKTPIA